MGCGVPPAPWLFPRMQRRTFLKSAICLAAAAGLERPLLALRMPGGPRRLSWLANRTAGREGAWRLTEIEGAVPDTLHGTLYRVAPGQSENHGVTLQHLFDGDAFAMGFSFRPGKGGRTEVHFRARYVPTPERLEELEAGRMLYSEVGTLAPADAPPVNDPMLAMLPRPLRLKNQPSVNVIHWDGRLLALSEGGQPTALSPADFSYEARWNFAGEVSPFGGFTAHPRFDPVTGEGYAHGYVYAPGAQPQLHVWRMELDGSLTTLHRLELERPWSVHDMLLTEEHIGLVIPPVAFQFEEIFQRDVCVTEAMEYLSEEPARLILLDREGRQPPRKTELPTALFFHHGNAFEADGKLVFDYFPAADGSLLEVLGSWSREELPPLAWPELRRVEVELDTLAVASRSTMGERMEFPRFDERRVGRDARYVYTAVRRRKAPEEDPLLVDGIARVDLHAAGRTEGPLAPADETYGEPVFVPAPGSDREDRGNVLVLGYSGGRDRTFLEIWDAGSMERAARVWLPDHYPLGFHGSFTDRAFVELEKL